MRNETVPPYSGGARIFNRIAELRAERRISRQELASAMDVNYQTIGFIERGNYLPSLNLAFSLAEYFSLPLEALFSRQPFEPLSLKVYGSGNRVRETNRKTNQS
jgi:DNA-binding XRE family transcriptional regulator